jgi:hypothetical protein
MITTSTSALRSTSFCLYLIQKAQLRVRKSPFDFLFMFKITLLVLKFSSFPVQTLLHIVCNWWWLISLSSVVACQHQIRWVLRHFKVHQVRIVLSSIFLSRIDASSSERIHFVCSWPHLFRSWENTSIVVLISININNDWGHVKC